MKIAKWVPAIVVALATASASAADRPVAPYAGQEARSIKALSDDDIAALRKGEGMGFAKAAELNGYPGPAHVLTLAVPLGLSDAQKRDVTAIFERMSAAAKPLGNELIGREQVLDQLFSKREISAARLSVETIAIAALQGRLRAVHLAAHLETRALLTADQIARYAQLRGYGGSRPSVNPHHHHG